MPLRIRLECSNPFCKVKTDRLRDPDNPEGYVDCAQPRHDPDDGDFMLVLDTGWIDAPAGWTVGGDGEVYCPDHKEEP